MDPLSISVSAINFITFMQQILSWLRDLKGAPREVEQLWDELGNLETVIHALRPFMESFIHAGSGSSGRC